MNVQSAHVVLVSCVGQKLERPAAACDIYTSALFTGMRTYAEMRASRWFILSALHGVLKPTQVIEPYEQTLNKMGAKDRQEWTKGVCQSLSTLLLPDDSVTVLAGERYRAGVVPYLRERGFDVEIPMQGLRIGEQLRWLKQHNSNGS